MFSKQEQVFLVILVIAATTASASLASESQEGSTCQIKASFSGKVVQTFKRIFDYVPRCAEELISLSGNVTEKAFRRFVKIYNKDYVDDSAEYRRRFSIFRQNAIRVFKSQFDYYTGKSTYLMNINKFSDMVSIESNFPIEEKSFCWAYN